MWIFLTSNQQRGQDGVYRSSLHHHLQTDVTLGIRGVVFSPSLLSLRQQRIGESSLTVFEQSLVALALDITLCSASNEKSWGLSQSEIPPKQLLRPHSLQVLVCELRSGSTVKGQATWEGKKDYYTLRKGNNEWITAVANWTLTPLGTLWIVPVGGFLSCSSQFSWVEGHSWGVDPTPPPTGTTAGSVGSTCPPTRGPPQQGDPGRQGVGMRRWPLGGHRHLRGFLQNPLPELHLRKTQHLTGACLYI